MSDKSSSLEAGAIVKELVAYIQKQAPAQATPQLVKLAQQYYDKVALDDLQARPMTALYASLLSHWTLLQVRKQNELKIKVSSAEQPITALSGGNQRRN